MKRKKYFYSLFGDDNHSSHTEIQSHSEALKQVSGRASFSVHLHQQKGKILTLITFQERLTGIVEQVYSDHVLFRVLDVAYHIPITSILYFHE